MLSGYKTYLLAIVAIVYAVSSYYTGHTDGKVTLDMIWTALTAAALRNGITTETK